LPKCIDFSKDNAQRLIEDAEYLLNADRLSSAYVLATYALEECGKALLAYDYFAAKKKVTEGNRKNKFTDHPYKIKRALKFLGQSTPSEFAKEIREETLERIFVDYDRRLQQWVIPWNQDPTSLLKVYGAILSPEQAKAIRETQGEIDKNILVGRIIEFAKTIVASIRISENEP